MKTIILGGAPASGKTAILKHIIHHLKKTGAPAVCKIDCIQSSDLDAYQALGIPAVQGLSEDICPDHFLATNLTEIHQWGLSKNASHLFIETAGLCNRCAPFVSDTLNICVVDAMGSIRAPEKLGPVLTTSHVLLITKCDLVSQAEREVLSFHLKKLNPAAVQFEADGLSGFGSMRLTHYLSSHTNASDSLEGSLLCYPMPSANCAYCVGEIRIGSNFQQGMIKKMSFQEDSYASNKY